MCEGFFFVARAARSLLQESAMKKLWIAALTLCALALPLQAAEPDKSLYERLGGVFAIAAVVDHFSDALVENPIVGKTSKNPALEGMAHQEPRPTAGPQVHADPLGLRGHRGAVQVRGDEAGQDASWVLEEAHRDLKITSAEFDEVAAELGRSLDFAKVPAREKGEVLAAFAAHKEEVTAGAAKK
jgi:hemoglobin